MVARTILKLVTSILSIPFLVLAAQDTTDFAKAGGLYAGVGIMGSGNFQKDMYAFLGGSPSGGDAWVNISLLYACRVYKGLYIVPEFDMSNISVKRSIKGFEATPNESNVALYQYGAGLRYYLFNLRYKFVVLPLFVQPSLRGVTGSSSVNGFPVKADGLAKELKIGIEGVNLRNPRTRVGLEMGYTDIPVKKTIDPEYIKSFATPTTALGGEYGGMFLALTFSYWFGGKR